MSFNLVQILSHMGPLGMVIAAFLITMAIACVGVVVERLIALRRSARESRLFAESVPALLEEWRLDELRGLADRLKASALARLFSAVLRRYERAIRQTDAEGA